MTPKNKKQPTQSQLNASNEKWEERFDNKFLETCLEDAISLCGEKYVVKEIKDFIQALLQEQSEILSEALRKTLTGLFERKTARALKAQKESFKKMVEGKMKNVHSYWGMSKEEEVESSEKENYNQALKDLLTYESESSLPELLEDARQKERHDFINKLKGLKMEENKKVKTKSFQFVADAMIDMANFQAKRFNTKISNLIKEYENE